MIIRLCSISCFLVSNTLTATNIQYIQKLGKTVEIATHTYRFGGKTAQLIGYLNIGPHAYYRDINDALKGKPLIYMSAASWPNLKSLAKKINPLTNEQRRYLACAAEGACFMMSQKCGISTALEGIDPDVASTLVSFATLPSKFVNEESQILFKKRFGHSEQIDTLYEEKVAQLPSWEEFVSLLVNTKLPHDDIEAVDEENNAKILSRLANFETNEKGNVVVLQPLGSMPFLEKELVDFGWTLNQINWIEYASLQN